MELPEELRPYFDQLRASRHPPEGRVGLVLVDFDKTISDGDSHNAILLHAFQTRLDEIRRLPDARQRLLSGVRMVRLYQTHRLHPGVATELVGNLLHGLPIMPVAREWAEAGAQLGLKMGVIRKVHEEALRVVRGEWEAKIAAEKMKGPINEELLALEAQKRIVIVSSQFADVLRLLAPVLGIPPENFLGSTGTFTEDGHFDRAGFFYCFGPNKVTAVQGWLEHRGLKLNPKTTCVFTDDHYNDGPLLLFAAPENQWLVDPDADDTAYARSEGTHVLYDRWDELRVARFVPRETGTPQPAAVEETAATAPEGGTGPAAEEAPHPGAVQTLVEGKGRMELRVEEDHRFFFDSRAVVSPFDAVIRATFGMIDMLPAAAIEVTVDLIAGRESQLPAAAIPLGAGLVYGLMNRTPAAHLVVGAVTAAGMASVHSQSPILSAAVAALVGGGTLMAAKFLATRSYFQPKAKKLGHKAFRHQTRWANLLARWGLVALWNGGLRLMGLG